MQSNYCKKWAEEQLIFKSYFMKYYFISNFVSLFMKIVRKKSWNVLFPVNGKFYLEFNIYILILIFNSLVSFYTKIMFEKIVIVRCPFTTKCHKVHRNYYKMLQRNYKDSMREHKFQVRSEKLERKIYIIFFLSCELKVKNWHISKLTREWK